MEGAVRPLRDIIGYKFTNNSFNIDAQASQGIAILLLFNFL